MTNPKQKLVVLTGAGMSAESGIATFRDSGGLWEQYRIEDVATPEGWHKNPSLVLDFYNQRRNQLLAAQPNEGHRILAQLEPLYDVQIITQNVDNLHERAGSHSVLHLHGELMKVRSTGTGQEVFDIPPYPAETRLGDLCPKGYQLRPHIVWFGEAVPAIEQAAAMVEEADILLIVGTSLQVYPAAGLLHSAKSGVQIFLIDPQPPAGAANVRLIRMGASEGMKEFISQLGVKQ